MITYKIIFDYLSEDRTAYLNITREFHNKEKANKYWADLKATNGVANIRTEVVEETVYNTVDVSFGGSMVYTYLTNIEMKAGEKVVVQTAHGLEILKVLSAGPKTETELKQKLPLDRYKYIIGKLVAA